MKTHTAAYWIEALSLSRHPEGGFFRETYRSEGTIGQYALPSGFRGPRNYCTGIYYLLRSGEVSKLHRILSDEIWHFYAGASLTLFVFEGQNMVRHLLGNNPGAGESLQLVVPAGCWFGARVNAPDGFTLAGCTVAPGFDFRDFEMGQRDKLIAEFPGNEAIIKDLT